MAHKIIWSPEAIADLVDLRDYIARDSPTYAAAMAERILAATDRLSDFPLSGREVPELDDISIRELVISSFRVIYRVRAESADIAAIVHGARRIQDALANRKI